jgi:hypothetical protein
MTADPSRNAWPPTKMPLAFAPIVALLRMNDDVAATSTPFPLPEMLPLLVMPPAKAETDETSTPVVESERTPAFPMPPPKVGVSMTAIAALLLPTIVLLLSTFSRGYGNHDRSIKKHAALGLRI